MAVTSSPELRVDSALKTCVGALSKIADYRLEASLQRRLDDLGGRKEFLGPDEHDELLGLVEFSQRRTIESLEARLALNRLRDAFPDAVQIP